MTVLQIPHSGLPDQLALKIIALTQATWPPKNPVAKSEQEALADFRNRIEGRQLFVIVEEELLGYAELFPRTIYTENGMLNVMALASVCVSIESRGLGIGKKIVEACFNAVEQSDLEVSLFQTGVPDFYGKLGCVQVHNTFVDKTNKEAPDAYPFTDDYTMIYPSSYAWPSGMIDINGKGY